jgi:uncharacterized protein involved in exopolysaccharide biosynthesis
MNNIDTQQQGSGGTRKIDVFASLRRHKKMGIIAFFVVLALGFPLAFLLGRPTYSTQAVIYISPRFAKNLEDDKELELQSNQQYREFVQQNVRTINRYDIVEETLKRLGDHRSQWQLHGETDRRAIERLQAALKIQAVPDTYQITVELESKQKQGLDEIVNTLVNVFLEKSHQEDFFDNDQRLNNLKTERDRIDEQIQKNMAEKTRISSLLGVSSFSEGFANPYDKLLVDAKGSLAAARERQITADAQLESLKNAGAAKAYGSDLASKDAALTSLQANLNSRRSELLKTISGLSPNHPGRKAAETELAQLDSVLLHKSDELTAKYINNLLQQRSAESFAAYKTEKGLEKEVQDQSDRAAFYSTNFQHALEVGADIEHERQRLDAVDSRISFLMLESSAPGFARFFSRALPADMPAGGKKRRIAMMAMFLGILLGIGLPVAADFIDPRIHTAGDAGSVLGFKPMAEMPVESLHGEYRARLARFAAAIEREMLQRGSHIFLFTPLAGFPAATKLLADLRDELNSISFTTALIDETQGRISSVEDESFSALAARRAMLAAAEEHQVVLVAARSIQDDAHVESLIHFADVCMISVQACISEKYALKQAAQHLERCNPKAVGCVVTDVAPERLTIMTEQKAGTPLWLTPWLWR